MRILVLTYNYGDTASGVVTYRVVSELKRQGNEVFVITSETSIKDNYVIECPNRLSDNSVIIRGAKKLYRLLTGDLLEYNFLWRKRAYKRSLEVIEQYKIDWIYCRTTPLDSCVVGSKLKKKTNLKLLLHFTDPVPSEYSTHSKWLLNILIKKYGKIAEQSDLVSYGTKEMQKCQESLFHISDGKSFVSPDAASSSEPLCLPNEKGDLKKLVYFGGFGDYRDPYPLFEAIEAMNKVGTKVILLVYMRKPLTQKAIPSNVTFMGRTDDMKSALAEADILVDLDVINEKSVYLSSKIKDYILVNRPILAITRAESPTFNLVKGMNSFICCENEKDKIIESINAIMHKDQLDFVYEERQLLIDYFSPYRVAKEILEKMRQ